MRLGMEVTWETIDHTELGATATIDIWTENQYTHSGDTQTLNYSSNLGSDTNYTNNSGGSPVQRATKSYEYVYSSSSYGTSPGTVTFSAELTGHYWDDGTNPTVSITSSIPARPALAPDAPVLTATAASSSQINLSWTTPDNQGSALDAYVLQVSSTSSTTGFANLFSDSTLPLSTSYSHTGLPKYSTRWYRVLASNGVGNSAYSAVKSARTSATVPGAPTGLTATPGVSSVALTWTAPTDTGGIGLDETTDYVVKRGTTTLGYSGSATAFTDTGVTPATAYTYTVAAVNSVGTGTADSVSTTTIGGIVRVWDGNDWATWSGLPQVYNGSTWVVGNARVYTGVGATEDAKWEYGI
jgi:hypothetical protein